MQVNKHKNKNIFWNVEFSILFQNHHHFCNTWSPGDYFEIKLKIWHFKIYFYSRFSLAAYWVSNRMHVLGSSFVSHKMSWSVGKGFSVLRGNICCYEKQLYELHRGVNVIKKIKCNNVMNKHA